MNTLNNTKGFDNEAFKVNPSMIRILKNTIFKWGILFILINIVSCHNRETRSGCVEFKTGEFWYNGFIIERNDSIQTEKIRGQGLLIRKRIHWINECEYELTFLSATPKDSLSGRRDIMDERKGGIQKIKIVETTKDYYIFEGVDSKGEIYEGKVSVLKVGGFKSIGDIFPAEK